MTAAVRAQKVEATTGFEPVNRGFAGLTALRDHTETTPIRATSDGIARLHFADQTADQEDGAMSARRTARYRETHVHGDCRCIFTGCVSTDAHSHGGFYGGCDDLDDMEGPPIAFTSEAAPGVRDYNGALLPPAAHLRQSTGEGR